MTSIDVTVCAQLVREVTDRLASEFTPAPADEDIGKIISRVRTTSAAAEATMREALERLYPGIDWGGEDSLDHQQRDSGRPRWIYDPIDGAYHYLQALPLWSASLALVKDGRAILSVIYDPTMRELFCAEVGQGVTVNGMPAYVSEKPDLATGVLATAIPPRGSGPPAEQAEALRQLGAVCDRAFVVRQMASASLQLAYVASGRLDGYWEVGDDVNDWLAGALMVTEAGGTLSDLQGGSFGVGGIGIVAASPRLHEQLLAELK